ncbi:MAG: 3-hydroxyacyl-CoA dehydrogenase family protein [Bacillota bacterium]
MITKVSRVGVLGAGLMGHGIAQMAAQKANCEVTLVDISEKELTKGYKTIKKLLEKDLQNGKIDQEIYETVLAKIITSTDIDSLKECDVVIECIPEDMNLKKEAFALLDSVVKPEAILTSNTSQFSITEIASATKRTKQVVGTHFFYPVQVMKLVEIPVGEDTSPACINTIFDFCKSMGKEPCVCKDTPGFIVNRLLGVFLAEATRMYDEQIASVEEIDKAVRNGLGHPMGPFQIFDMSGIDTILKAIDSCRQVLGERYLVGTGVRNKVRAGNYGQKTGSGFYNYAK